MLLYCVYKIISLKLKGVSKELTLQMAVKAINNFTSLNRLILILLVFIISVPDDQPIINCLYYILIIFCYCRLGHGLENC